MTSTVPLRRRVSRKIPVTHSSHRMSTGLSWVRAPFLSISRPVDQLTTPEPCPAGLSKLIVSPLSPHVCSQTQGI